MLLRTHLIFLQNEKNVFIGVKTKSSFQISLSTTKASPRACLTYFSLNRTQYLQAYIYRLKGVNNGVANVCSAYEGWATTSQLKADDNLT